jgi:hypothetical protein
MNRVEKTKAGGKKKEQEKRTGDEIGQAINAGPIQAQAILSPAVGPDLAS